MLPRKTNRPRCLASCVISIAFGWQITTGSALFAQTEAVPDPSAPPTESAPVTPATPPAQATPVTPTESAATTAPDSNLSSAPTSSYSAGPTPSTGPGASSLSNLGDRLNSATAATRLPFRLTASLGEAYNNNIFAAQHKQSDYITRLSLSGEYVGGTLARVDGVYVGGADSNLLDVLYNPSLHLYARHSGEDGVDQYVDALYAHRFTKLTLSLEQVYSSLQSTDAAVGGLVTSDVYTTLGNANFVYSEKLDLVAEFKQEFTSFDQPAYTDSKQWSGGFYGLYHLDDRLSVGIGPNFGYLNLQQGPDQTYEQIVARAIYVVSAKLNFKGEVGGEDRQYQSPESDSVNPIFEFSGVYLPEPSTYIAMDAGRRFRPSYNFIGQNYIATNVDLNVKQRLLHYYYLGLVSGYENDDYHVIDGTGGGPTREDNFFYFQPSLSWKPNGWLEVVAFDKYEEDNSNFMVFSYDTNQVGVSVSATY